MALTLWLLAAVIPMSQLALGAEEQRSQGSAARQTAILTTNIAASNARAQFAAQAMQAARELGVRAEGRRIGATSTTPARAADEETVADAEDRAAEAAESIVTSMARPPDPADQLPSRLMAAVSSEAPDWAAGLATEHAEADRSSRWGNRSNNAVQLAALLATILYAVTLLHQRIAESATTSPGPR